jgi:hypothetical protein
MSLVELVKYVWVSIVPADVATATISNTNKIRLVAVVGASCPEQANNR